MRRATETGRWVLAVALAGPIAFAGCHRHVASAADCRAVLDRLVDLELEESGYRDAALAVRWRAELARRFESDLSRCETLHVRDDLAGCLGSARSSEEIAHRCVE